MEMGGIAQMPTSTSTQANGATSLPVGSQDGHTISAEESTAALQHQPTAGPEEGEVEVEEPILDLPTTIGLLAVVTVVRTASRHATENMC